MYCVQCFYYKLLFVNSLIRIILFSFVFLKNVIFALGYPRPAACGPVRVPQRCVILVHHDTIVFPAVASACGLRLLWRRPPCRSPSFASADSLADVDADSARRLLGSLRDEMESSSRSVRNHYALLCIKADDKAYIRQTSDSAILRLVDYYEHGGDERLLPVAYYYAGRAYRALNDAPQALDYLQKAAEAGERIIPNAKLLGRIYAQIGYVLSYQCIYQEALTNHKKSYQINRYNKDTLSMLYNLRDIGEE